MTDDETGLGQVYSLFGLYVHRKLSPNLPLNFFEMKKCMYFELILMKL